MKKKNYSFRLACIIKEAVFKTGIGLSAIPQKPMNKLLKRRKNHGNKFG